MNTNLATARPGQNMVTFMPMNRQMADRVSFWKTRIEGDVFNQVISNADAPTSDQRFELSARKDALSGLMRPCGMHRASAEWAGLVAAMASKNSNEHEFEAENKICTAAIAGRPAFAVSRVCREFREGHHGVWLPKCAELCQKIDLALRSAQDELADLSKILAAKVLPPPEKSSPERRAEIAAMARGQPMGDSKTARELERAASAKRVRAMADEFLADNGKAPNRLPTPEEHAAEMARIKSDNTAHPIELSDRLKAKLGQTA